MLCLLVAGCGSVVALGEEALTAVPLGVELLVPVQAVFLVLQAGRGGGSSMSCQERDVCDCLENFCRELVPFPWLK